jgi:hypothetical protein
MTNRLEGKFMSDKKRQIRGMIRTAMYELAEKLDYSGAGCDTILEETGHETLYDYFNELLEDVYDELEEL